MMINYISLIDQPNISEERTLAILDDFRGGIGKSWISHDEYAAGD